MERERGAEGHRGAGGRRLILFSLILLLCALFPAQSVVAQARAGGTLEVRIKDHRNAIDDFSRLEIVLDAVLVSPKSGLTFWRTAWVELEVSLNSVDLTKYSANRSVAIFKNEVAPGSFEAIHLKLKDVAGSLKVNKGSSTVKNVIGPIKLDFSVKPRETTLIVLDLTVIDMSDHPPRGYELQLQGYELYRNGKLIEKVPPL